MESIKNLALKMVTQTDHPSYNNIICLRYPHASPIGITYIYIFKIHNLYISYFYFHHQIFKKKSPHSIILEKPHYENNANTKELILSSSHTNTHYTSLYMVFEISNNST